MVVLLVGLAVGCKDPKPSVYPTQPQVIADSTVGPTDVLTIRVAKQDELSGDYELDAKGQFSFPYVGIVDGTGKTPLQIGEEIQAKLADGYLRDPQVSVLVKEFNSRKVSVFGEVRHGAILPFSDGMTIVEAISAAGGFTPRAWENAVKVTRKAKEFTVPVEAIANGSAPVFYMRPGDAVYVPKSPM